MKEIKLKNTDKKAMVDDLDFDYINQFEWVIDEDGYAITFIEGKKVYMHDTVLAYNSRNN